MNLNLIDDLLEVIQKEEPMQKKTFYKIITVMDTYNLNLDTIVKFTCDGVADLIGKKWICRKIKN